MQKAQVKVGLVLATLNKASYGLLAGAALLCLTAPGLLPQIGLPAFAALPLAFQVALNGAAIAFGAYALRFKFRNEEKWPTYVLATALICMLLVGAVNGGLLWRMLSEQRLELWPLVIFAAPLTSLAWLSLIAQRDAEAVERSEDLVDQAFGDETAPTDDPIHPRSDGILVLAQQVTRMAVIAIISVQLIVFAAMAAYLQYDLLWRVLVEEVTYAPGALGRVIAALPRALLDGYLDFAGPLAVITAKWLAAVIGVVLLIAVPVVMAASAIERNLFAGRITLTGGQKDWIQSSAKLLLAWLETRPKRALDTTVMTVLILCSILAAPALYVGASWQFSRLLNGWMVSNEQELFRILPGIAGPATTLAAGMAAFMLIVMAGVQLVPVVKDFMLSTQRRRLEKQTDIVTDEVLSALESAVRNGWFSTDKPFSPVVFHKRWTWRGMNAGRTIALYTLPAVLAATAFDALWFQSWRSDAVLYSSPFSVSAQTYPYAEAREVRGRCALRETDDGARPDLGYALVFADGTKLQLKTRAVRDHKHALAAIDATATSAGAPKTFEDGSDQDACLALLKDRWPDEANALAALLAPAAAD